jgi:hypothetical protein
MSQLANKGRWRGRRAGVLLGGTVCRTSRRLGFRTGAGPSVVMTRTSVYRRGYKLNELGSHWDRRSLVFPALFSHFDAA